MKQAPYTIAESMTSLRNPSVTEDVKTHAITFGVETDVNAFETFQYNLLDVRK